MKGDDIVNNFYEYDEQLRKEVVLYISDNDINCTEFARQIGCSNTTIQRFVKGNYKLGRNIKRKILRKIDMNINVEDETDLYNIKELSNSDKCNMISIVMDDMISKLKNELEILKSDLYELEWKRDQLHNLLKGL